MQEGTGEVLFFSCPFKGFYIWNNLFLIPNSTNFMIVKKTD